MDDEIIIGIQRESNKTKVKKMKNNKKAVKKTASNNNKKMDKSKRKKNRKSIEKKESKTKKIKFLIIIVFSIIFMVLFLSSSFFNINEIVTKNNDIISYDEIVSLSKIEKHTNIFSTNKKVIILNLKENPYIESANIKRKLPDTIEIYIKERIPKYMIQFADSYVYINNQGYMLDISNEKLDLPIILGFTTDLSNIQAGNRLDIEDLSKMDMIIKITEIANSNEIGEFISKIDVSDERNYTLILESEGKKVYLGDASDLNTKILYLKSILEATTGVSGEIFLNIDLNTRDAYFRESVN